MEDALKKGEFIECGQTQETSSGWVTPRGEEHGALMEIIGGRAILKLRTDSKSVPSSAIKDELKKKLAAIETETGRKPGKKEQREIKEDLMQQMLPRAFVKSRTTMAWADSASGLLIIGTASAKVAEVIVNAMMQAADETNTKFGLKKVQTQMDAGAAMSIWLSTQENPRMFTVDMECELKAADESKAVVKYARHTLDIEEIVGHIKAGKMATKLAMTWNDKVSFVLCQDGSLKKIEILDVDTSSESASKEDQFAATATILTQEISALLPDLMEALGGEVEAGVEAVVEA